MALNNKYLAKIHIAKKELSLDDDSYRAVIARACNGKSSAKDLTLKEAGTLIEEFKRLGWEPEKSKKQHKKKADNPQVRYIYVLWGLLKKHNVVYAEAPHAFCEVMLKQQCLSRTVPSHIEWIKDQQDLSYLIEILKDKCQKAGIELDN